MVNESKNLYSPGMSPRALAEKVLKDRFGEKMPSIPIDPFKLMREYGIVYQLMEFENLEGIYLFVRKNKDDKISKEFYYLGRMAATGRTREFQMPNTTKTAVEIEWNLDTPVREDIYQYIIS